LRELQQAQLELLLRHAATTVPYYRERWRGDAKAFTELAPLTGRELQENYEKLKSNRVPPEHGTSSELRTSGSTGGPKRVLRTQLCQLIWDALTLREHLWHARDFSQKLAVIRRGPSGVHPSWGGATAGVFTTGPAVGIRLEADVDSQVAWLRQEDPAYFLTYPSLLREMALACRSHGIRVPGLHHARTLSEIVTPELRQLCREAWGVPVVDMYSSEEVGFIAAQCPQREHYHVHAETLLVEVLDGAGRPCSPGEVGRVIVTDLHNFATPLIRYDLGDFAEVGPPCPCGRGLPVLTRIIGRTRNTLVTVDGRRHYPLLGQTGFLDIAPVLQHQFVQTAFDVVEARIVTREPLEPEQVQRLQAHVAKRLPAGIRIEVVRVDSIPRSAGGKYEDFISLVEH
jgi:phenylacetate-CoA ligase